MRLILPFACLVACIYAQEETDPNCTENECIVDVEEEFALNEFFESSKDDPMIAQVIASLNALLSQQDAMNITKSAAGEWCDDEITPDHPSFSELSEDCQLIANEKAALSEEMQSTFNEQNTAIEGLKRFVELKQLVAWLQPKDKRISRYCFYGCWCLPEGAHSFVAGEGRPVDAVDKACQQQWFCYECAKEEFRGIFDRKEKHCNPDKARYAFKFKYDKKHPAHYDKRRIVCKDEWKVPMDTKWKWRRNCAKAICECDKGLAIRLYKSWKAWDKSRHRIWSQSVNECKQVEECNYIENYDIQHKPNPSFNPNASKQDHDKWDRCIKRGCLFIVKRRCLKCDDKKRDEDCGETSPSELFCCGLFEDDGGRVRMRDHDGVFGCCDHDTGATGNANKNGLVLPWSGNYYNKITHCCIEGTVSECPNPPSTP